MVAAYNNYSEYMATYGQVQSHSAAQVTGMAAMEERNRACDRGLEAYAAACALLLLRLLALSLLQLLQLLQVRLQMVQYLLLAEQLLRVGDALSNAALALARDGEVGRRARRQ